ncbi:arsenate reductase (glutaredoxin) [Francisellaceae bacterium CB299]|jgi:arsenate reductase
MKIYHNPKCSKSREAKKLLDEKGIAYTTHLYLENPLSSHDIKALLVKLGLTINDIIRTKESLWKENFKDSEFTDKELVEIVANNPRLLERPIIEHGEFAVVARSDEKIAEILSML